MIKVKEEQVTGKHTHIKKTVSVDLPLHDFELFAVMVNEIREALDVNLKETCKALGLRGTDQDARNIRRCFSGDSPIDANVFLIAAALTGRAKVTKKDTQ